MTKRAQGFTPPHGLTAVASGKNASRLAPHPSPSLQAWFRRGAGFTLVELLVVIAILGILMSLVTAGAQTARRRGAIAKAKATIAALETAIAMYHGDLGDYPSSDNANLVTALTQDGGKDWLGPYMEFKQDELVGGEVVDPWGQPYVYVSSNGGSPQHREHSYDLSSFGPNGQDDGGAQDDIINW